MITTFERIIEAVNHLTDCRGGYWDGVYKVSMLNSKFKDSSKFQYCCNRRMLEILCGIPEKTFSQARYENLEPNQTEWIIPVFYDPENHDKFIHVKFYINEPNRIIRNGKSSYRTAKHQLYMKCPICGKPIPAGRWRQHSEIHEYAFCALCGNKFLKSQRRKHRRLHRAYDNYAKIFVCPLSFEDWLKGYKRGF